MWKYIFAVLLGIVISYAFSSHAQVADLTAENPVNITPPTFSFLDLPEFQNETSTLSVSRRIFATDPTSESSFNYLNLKLEKIEERLIYIQDLVFHFSNSCDKR